MAHMSRRCLLARALGVAMMTNPLACRSAARQATPVAAANCLAIEDVTILSMAPGTELEPNMTVLIEGERIASIAPAAQFTRPVDCAVVDGRGKWLIPGLFDMHVHFLSEPIPELEIDAEDMLAPYLVNGVQQIVDMAATPYTNEIRDAVEAGEIVAPLVASAAMIDGSPALRPGAREAATVEDAPAVVAEIAAAGFDFVKVYSRLEPDVFAAVLVAADEAGIRVIGHLPGNREASPADLIQPGFAMIAHAEEFAWLAPEKSDAEIAAFVALMQESGAALTSTLYLDQQILAQTRTPAILSGTEGLASVHPVMLMLWFEENGYLPRRSPERIADLEAVVEFNDRLVRAMVAGGVPVLAGTDASFVPGLAPGFALHEELAALVGAGLTPRQALEAATIVPARWLGVLDDRGTVEVGKRANLVLLDGDPLVDIRDTRDIAAVVFNGELFDRAARDARLAALDALYARYRPWFSPVAVAALERQA